MKIFGTIATVTILALGTTSTLAQERAVAPAERPVATGDLQVVEPGGLRFECQSYSCTCTIGDDCREMFDTLKVVNCGEGGPGELECEVAPQD